MQQPGRRELNKQRCRANILKSARKLFRARGYEDTTIEEIADAASVSRATLYNYFPCKENLLTGIADAALDEVRLLIRRERKKGAPAQEILRQVLTALAVDAVRYLPLSRRILYLNAFPESSLYPTRRELLDILGDLAEQARQEGSLRAELTAAELAEAFLGLYLLSQFGWPELPGMSEADCRARVDRMVDRALAGIGAEKEEPHAGSGI